MFSLSNISISPQFEAIFHGTIKITKILALLDPSSAIYLLLGLRKFVRSSIQQINEWISVSEFEVLEITVENKIDTSVCPYSILLQGLPR